MNEIKVIAFDADDTLWVNETIFTKTQEQFKQLLSEYVDKETLGKSLYETEIRNLHLFGYGVKGFTLSMIETAIELSEGAVNGKQIQKIIDLGKDMLAHSVEVLPNVKQTIEILKEDYELMVITKGDLFDQESKLARSGLADLFDKVEIVSEKKPEVYQDILDRHEIPVKDFLMVGNSLKSDILPVCEIGGMAIHIPFHTTWGHEVVSHHQAEGYDYEELADVSLLPAFLSSLTQD